MGFLSQTIQLDEIESVDIGEPIRWGAPHTLLIQASGHSYDFEFDPILSDGAAGWLSAVSLLLEERNAVEA